MSNPRIHVLLIADDGDRAGRLREALSTQSVDGFDLAWAREGGDGLRLAGRDGVDVVLLDLAADDGRGLDTLRQLCDRTPDTPVVVLTGSDGDDLGIQAVRQGAQDHLVTDEMSPALLARSLRYAVERRGAGRGRLADDADYRTMVENAIDEVAVVEGDGTMRFMSPSVVAVLGYEPASNTQTMQGSELRLSG